MKHYLQWISVIRGFMEQFSFSLITAIIAVMIGVFLALTIRKGKSPLKMA